MSKKTVVYDHGGGRLSKIFRLKAGSPLFAAYATVDPVSGEYRCQIRQILITKRPALNVRQTGRRNRDNYAAARDILDRIDNSYDGDVAPHTSIGFSTRRAALQWTKKFEGRVYHRPDDDFVEVLEEA